MDPFEKQYAALFSTMFVVMLVAAAFSLFLDPQDGRKALIRLYSDFRLSLHDRVFQNVIVGEEGWLYYTGENSDDDYQNTFVITKDELDATASDLEALGVKLESQGSALVVVIAPNKPTIYSEYMPPEIKKLKAESRLDRLAEAIKDSRAVIFLDLRKPLLRAKNDQQIYYKTDTHWNDLGGYIAYREILSSIGIDPHPLSEYEVVETDLQTLDLAANIGTSLMRESKIALTPKFDLAGHFEELDGKGSRKIQAWLGEDQTKPKALIYHDSFFFSVIPMLAPHFSRAVFVPHFSDANWTLDWIDRERPDFVIIEFAERYIQELGTLTTR